MNRKTKSVVYEILETEKLAREDTLYLIQQVLIRMLNCNQGSALIDVLQGMKYNGISFESITRHKRKFFEKYPEYLTKEIEEVRRNEEDQYYEEFKK